MINHGKWKLGASPVQLSFKNFSSWIRLGFCLRGAHNIEVAENATP